MIDLDNTIYPESSGLMQAISERISLFMVTQMELSIQETQKLRQKFKKEYGTTLQGLRDLFGIDQEEYLSYVHDIDLSAYLQSNDDLVKILAEYPQTKVVFSNADCNHILKVLNFLKITHLFELIIDVHMVAPYVKPQPESFKITMDLLGLSSWNGCVFIDDYLPNILAATSQGIFGIQVDESMETAYQNKISKLCELPKIIPTK